jgi:hypothetical protein
MALLTARPAVTRSARDSSSATVAECYCWHARSRAVPGRSAKGHHNLPAHRVRLNRRQQDLEAARQALLGTQGRLSTPIGTGGCGTTRLALEVAADLVPAIREGVWLVELAPLTDPCRSRARTCQPPLPGLPGDLLVRPRETSLMMTSSCSSVGSAPRPVGVEAIDRGRVWQIVNRPWDGRMPRKLEPRCKVFAWTGEVADRASERFR